MIVTVKKWGNSAAVRIPASVMEATKLLLDSRVDVRAEEGRIVIEPIREPEYDLDALVRGITKDNLHDEIDFGRPVGREVF